MLRTALTLLGAAALLVGCGSASARPTLTTTAPPASTTTAPAVDRVLVVGDSLARELFLPLEYGLERGGSVRVDFASVPSIPREPELEAIWLEALARHRPDVVVVLVGYWEVGVMADRLPPPAAYESGVVGPFVADATSVGARVVWVGPPAVRPEPTASMLAELSRRYAAYHAIEFVDGNALVSGPDGTFTEVLDGERVRRPDGLHLCPAGSARIAGAVFDRLEVPVAAGWESAPWRTGLFSGVEVCGPS